MRSSQFINDFSKIAQGAVTTINALKDELDILISQRLERFLAKQDLAMLQTLTAHPSTPPPSKGGHNEAKMAIVLVVQVNFYLPPFIS